MSETETGKEAHDRTGTAPGKHGDGQPLSRKYGATGNKQATCPECGGSLINDTEHGETVCEECGLVVEEDEIDPGPKWRAFDSSERNQKSRVGAPTTNMMHDKGLSTNIGWQDKDAYGNALSSRQREKMQRLRTWNERFRTRDSKERNLKQALGEIDRMASVLGLPENVRETASVIYRRALEDDLLPGRSIEGVATAALYAAARKAGTPRSAGVISGKSPVGLAAAAIYAAALLTNRSATQAEVGEVANISEVTIRNRYHELLDAKPNPV
jgi:transcription initiation factor TFIIB